jgi:hypothetical protein
LQSEIIRVPEFEGVTVRVVAFESGAGSLTELRFELSSSVAARMHHANEGDWDCDCVLEFTPLRS